MATQAALNRSPVRVEMRTVGVFTDTFDQVNGVSRMLRQLVRYCERHSLSIDIHTYGDCTGVERRDPIRIFRHRARLPLACYPDLRFDLWHSGRRVLRVCSGIDYGLIHAATPGSMGLLGARLAQSRSLPLIGSCQTALPERVESQVARAASGLRLSSLGLERTAKRLTLKYIGRFYDRCRLVLVPSQAIRQALQTHLSSPLKVFSRGVDAERFNPRFRRAEAGLTALYVGRLTCEKNLNLLVELFKHREDARLLVVGDGPYRRSMERQLDRAEFTGVLYGDRLSRAFASADLFVFPSSTDAFGNAVLEAMSSGLPVVVSDQGGPRELVEHEVTGFVAGGRDEFDTYVSLLIRDEGRRMEMGRQARGAALRQSWERSFDELFLVYREFSL